MKTTKIQCDFCKTEIKPTAHKPHVDITFEYNFSLPEKNYIYKLDLCIDCQSGLQIFINNKRYPEKIQLERGKNAD